MEFSCLCFLLGFLTRDLLGHRNSITSYGSLDSNGSRWEYNRNPLHLLRQFYLEFLEQMGVQQEPTPPTQLVLQGVLGVDGSTKGTHSTYSGSSIGSSWSRQDYNRNPLHLLKVVLRVDGSSIGTHSSYSGSSRNRWEYNWNQLHLLRQLYIGRSQSRWEYNRNSILLLRQFYRQYRSRWDCNRNPLHLLRQL